MGMQIRWNRLLPSERLMKINDLVLVDVQKALYVDAYLELTTDQVREIVETFPESLIETIEKTGADKVSTKKLVLNQLSLFLTEKEWPYNVDSGTYRNAWDVQMKAAFHQRGYKIRDA